ncbi:hypothetical protein [Paenibacillus endoradicis]|uniref:hypothetical protein n=1 Tax=Paenibacillus endoradicis TaxID=2972487 RepID=UPI002159AA5A|nr:hypothetical protein [Paenibacillus endoradicis]MCR8656723.1 hypothetical protein [Paenibacillus endoradicis]
MSQANIPNITPDISVTKEQSLHLLLSSVALNELAFSHLINAEAEKLQAFVAFAQEASCLETRDFLQINKAVSTFIEDLTMGQWINLKKLDRTIALLEEDNFEENCDE